MSYAPVIDSRFDTRFKETNSFEVALANYHLANRQVADCIQALVRSLDTLFTTVHVLSSGTDTTPEVASLCADSKAAVSALAASRTLGDIDTALRESFPIMTAGVSQNTETLLRKGHRRVSAEEYLNKFPSNGKNPTPKHVQAMEDFSAMDRDYRVHYDLLQKQRNRMIPRILSASLNVTARFAETLAGPIGTLSLHVRDRLHTPATPHGEASAPPVTGVAWPRGSTAAARPASSLPGGSVARLYDYPPVAYPAHAPDHAQGARVIGIPIPDGDASLTQSITTYRSPETAP